jgi:hypothetical protein
MSIGIFGEEGFSHKVAIYAAASVNSNWLFAIGLSFIRDDRRNPR